jgi:hypothetical protein
MKVFLPFLLYDRRIRIRIWSRIPSSSETWLYSRADGNIDESNEELRQQIIKIFKIVDMDMLDKCCPGPSCKYRKERHRYLK